MSPSTIVIRPEAMAGPRFCRRPRVKLSRITISWKPFGDQAIGDVRADQSRAASNQRSFVIRHAVCDLYTSNEVIGPKRCSERVRGRAAARPSQTSCTCAVGHRRHQRQDDAALLRALADRQQWRRLAERYGRLEMRVHDAAPRRHAGVEHPLHHAPLIEILGQLTQ